MQMVKLNKWISFGKVVDSEDALAELRVSFTMACFFYNIDESEVCYHLL